MVMMSPMDRRKSYWTDGVFRIGMKPSIVSFGVLMVGCTVAMAYLHIPMLGSQVTQMHSVNLLMPVFGDITQLEKFLKSLLVDCQTRGGSISMITGRGVQRVVLFRIFFMSYKVERITSKRAHTLIRTSMTTLKPFVITHICPLMGGLGFIWQMCSLPNIVTVYLCAIFMSMLY